MGLPGAPSNEVDVHEARNLIDEGKVRVVDVRTDFRFPAMAGADYIPLEDILARPQEVLPVGESVLFICNVGQTSGVATQMALAMGHAATYNMKGGMEAWTEAGYQTTEPPSGG